ncbi:MAG: thioredoxin [Deltaproteobacteria bacterium]|nr:thioredoxin [Deltaproteobacteria bacterium]
MATKEIISKTEFDNTIQNGVTLVDFNAPWCGPCRSQEPILERIAKQFDGRAVISAMNIDNNPNIALELGIQSIPTLIVFKNNKEMQRFIGLQPEKTLSGALEKLLD